MAQLSVRSRGSFSAAVLAFLLAAALAPATFAADTSRTAKRELTQLAPGVWSIRHADPLPGWVHGNTLVVIGSEAVFVVDACNVAWDAETDIAQIREWTDLPVRWLLNTHWHSDHNGGNHAYAQAFPGLQIVATAETKRRMDGVSVTLPSEILADTGPLRRGHEELLASGKGADGKPLAEAEVAQLKQEIADYDRVDAAVRSWVYQGPTCTFEDGLTLDLGGREVRVQWPGRGNTGGDAIAWLPKERILATGDLVVHPVPFVFDGYPKEWARTLEKLVALEPQIIVPGHGEILRDDAYMLLLRDLFRTVVQQIEAELDRDFEVPLEEVRRKVDVSEVRAAILARGSDGPRFFDDVLDKLVEFAWYEAKQG
jgi:cyclase